MADTSNLTNFLQDVADAIKEKKEYSSSQKIAAANFDTEISTIETGIDTSDATATAGDILNTKTAYVDGVKVTGTMANNGAINIIPSTSQQTIPPGYTSGGTVRAVDSTIDANIVAGNIKKDVTILGVTGTLEEGENLDTTVTALENQVSELTQALNDKASNIVKPNVYVQATEPLNKNGIWIETNAYQMEGIVADEDVFENETWNTTKMSNTSAIPYNFSGGHSAMRIGTNVYLFGDSVIDNYKNAYKYNVLTDTYIQLTNIPYNFSGSKAEAVGTDVYLFGGQNAPYSAYKYDTLTDTYTRLKNIPYAYNNGMIAVVGTNIYLIGSTSSGATNMTLKYDTLTNTYTKLTNTPVQFGSSYSGIGVVGTNIYIFGDSNSNFSAYKYDTLANAYTRLANSSTTLCQSTGIGVGSCVYLFGSQANPYNTIKYDTITNSYTRLTDTRYSTRMAGVVSVGDDEEIYIFGGYNSPTKVQIFELNSANYEDNQVVISQGVAKYPTNIINNDAGLKYWFNNAWIYTDQDGLVRGLPTYYGNGTSWIKFKN